MSQPETATDATAVLLTAHIVESYVTNNAVAASELPKLIASVHAALVSLDQPAPVTAEEPEALKKTPAEIRKSITPDALISFIDGKPYQTLRRHLTKHGLDPFSYRARYGLPNDYPLVAPTYSEKRSNLAKSIGLGVPGGRAPERKAA